MRDTERGYTAIWILILIALIVAGFSSMAFVDRDPNPKTYVVFGISLGVALLGLLIEAKRDLYSFCSGVILFGSITATITGAVAWFGMDPHPIAGVVAVLMMLAVLCCIGIVINTQYGHDPLRNILREEFKRGDIYDVDGVQFAAHQTATGLQSGEGFAIRVVAQNGWDAERTLVFKLKSETRISLNFAGMILESSPSLCLSGGEAGVLTIPVIAHPKAKGKYSLVANPSVTGGGGTRVRRWRAQPAPTHVAGWLTVIATLVGAVAWGGGMKFHVSVRRNKQAVDEPSPPLPAETEIIWTPEPHELTAATRAA